MGLYQFIYKAALKMKGDTEHLTYGRHHFKMWAKNHSINSPQEELCILDIGCGKGDDLLQIKSIIKQNSQLFAVEAYEEYRDLCKSRGIKAVNCNIENEPLPFENKSMDIVVINQVIEHTKDTFWVLSEISRVLKPGGKLLLGIPNLAAWHDRLSILMGQQPTCIHFPGPHVRGITKPGMIRFAEMDGYFKTVEVKGSAFYPFPEFMAQPLAKFFPSLATSLFFEFQRTKKEGTFIDVLKNRFYETNYYQGAPDE